MKKICIIALLSAGIMLICSKCQALEIIGEVYLEKHRSEMPKSSLNLIKTSVKYCVNLTIRNPKGKTISFDQVLVVFAPQEGSRLTLLSEQYELSKNKNGKLSESAIDQLEGENGMKMEISGKKEIKMDFSTGAYTANLIRNAGKNPIKVLVYLLIDGEVSAHPFYAMLTTKLNHLPYYDDAESRELKKGMKLTFYDIYYNE